MKSLRIGIVVASAVVLLAGRVTASGPLGIYGIVEKAVFEPNEAAAERVQIWGAFMYVEGAGVTSTTVSRAVRGYLYFTLPDAGFTGQTAIENTKREWADLKSVAGTGQAVAFGKWGYIAGFGSLQPDLSPTPPSVILHSVPRGGSKSDLRVRPASETPTAPAVYQINVGVVKLTEQGSHAAIVKRLKDALR